MKIHVKNLSILSMTDNFLALSQANFGKNIEHNLDLPINVQIFLTLKDWLTYLKGEFSRLCHIVWLHFLHSIFCEAKFIRFAKIYLMFCINTFFRT